MVVKLSRQQYNIRSQKSVNRLAPLILLISILSIESQQKSISLKDKMFKTILNEAIDSFHYNQKFHLQAQIRQDNQLSYDINSTEDLVKDQISQYRQNRLTASGESTCLRLLQNVTNYFLEYNRTLLRIFRNSGKDYNDLGRYEDCLNIKDEEYNYILGTIPRAFPIPLSIGICVPDVCEVQDFNNLKPFLVESINKFIPEIFQGLKGFDLSTQLITDDLKFSESKSKNDEATEGDIVSYLMIGFIVNP